MRANYSICTVALALFSCSNPTAHPPSAAATASEQHARSESITDSTTSPSAAATTSGQHARSESIADSATSPSVNQALKTDAIARQAACDRIADWRPEIIELPPEFAPSLPAGREELRFSPGMFDAASDDYFSYAFTLTFRERIAIDRTALESLMNDYFRGLMAAVAKSREVAIDVETIATTVTDDKHGLRANVDLIDAFTTGAQFTLRMKLDDDAEWQTRPSAGRCLRVQASSRPYSDPIWAQLRDASACLPCKL